MKSFPATPSDIVILARGEELHEQLNTYATDTGYANAWLSGLGGASSVTLGFYDPITRDYQWRTFDEPLEIVNLTGNLSWVDGEPFWHVHGTFSGVDYRTISGHVKQLNIGLTCELHITPHSARLTRTYDDQTGLKLLSDRPKPTN